MGTEKRERQKAGRQARLAAAQAEAAKKKRTRTAVVIGGVVVALVALTLVVGGLGSDDDGDDVATDGSTTTIAGDTTTTVGAFPEIPMPEPGAAIDGETPCPPDDGSAERTTSFAQAPPDCLTDGAAYQATITTDRGDIVIDLDAESSPVAVNNFVVLSRYHFYDGVAFHRIIPQFMIQTGDPIGPTPGTGGPGYSFADELTGSEQYPAGTVAMANSGPDTNGSQFFIMATGSSGLPADYTVFGTVASGQEVVDEINALGDAATNGTPTEIVKIESVTIASS